MENLCFLGSRGLAGESKGSPGPGDSRGWDTPPDAAFLLPGPHQEVPPTWNAHLTGSLLFLLKSAGV